MQVSGDSRTPSPKTCAKSKGPRQLIPLVTLVTSRLAALKHLWSPRTWKLTRHLRGAWPAAPRKMVAKQELPSDNLSSTLLTRKLSLRHSLPTTLTVSPAHLIFPPTPLTRPTLALLKLRVSTSKKRHNRFRRCSWDNALNGPVVTTLRNTVPIRLKPPMPFIGREIRKLTVASKVLRRLFPTLT